MTKTVVEVMNTPPLGVSWVSSYGTRTTKQRQEAEHQRPWPPVRQQVRVTSKMDLRDGRPVVQYGHSVFQPIKWRINMNAAGIEQAVALPTVQNNETMLTRACSAYTYINDFDCAVPHHEPAF